MSKQLPDSQLLLSSPAAQNSNLPALSTVPHFAAFGPQQEPDLDDDSIPVGHYFWIVRKSVWKILAFVSAVLLVTFLVSIRLQPIYESTVTIDVDRQAPSGIVGQDAMRNQGVNDADQFLATQVRLLQSDSVLRPVVDRYKLLEHEGQLKNLKATQLANLANAPIQLKNLKITRLPNTYLLRVGYQSKDPQLAASVANDIAKSYIEHMYRIRTNSSSNLSNFMERQLDELKAKMERSSGKLISFERELNVINPEEKTSILSARLLQLNTEYTSAQAERVRKEATYNSIRSGAAEAAQVSTQGESLHRLMEKLNEARERFAVVRATYGANYPEHRKAQSDVTELQRQFEEMRRNISSRIETDYNQAVNRERMLRQSVLETKGEFDRLNTRSFEYQQLKREADGDKQLYDELVRKIREAQINSGMQTTNVRIADPARAAAKPIFPKIRWILVLALLSSTLVGMAAAVLFDLLDTTIKDPEQASRMLRTDVIGTLPSVREVRAAGFLAAGASVGADGALVPYSRGDSNAAISSYEEAVRTLRNSILLGDFDRRIQSLLITSASPGEGKSTTAVHLAIAHSEQSKKTLLIDADLRRPSVHKKLGIDPKVGLSSVLNGEISWKEAIVQVSGHENLSIIPAGPPSRRASDLIGPRMVEILDEVAKEYDLIVVDAPPLLGFAEALQMANAVDGVVVVTRAGETNRKAVSTVLATLGRIRANVLGLVLNQVKKGMSDSYYYYGYYRKYYAAASGGGQ